MQLSSSVYSNLVSKSTQFPYPSSILYQCPNGNQYHMASTNCCMAPHLAEYSRREHCQPGQGSKRVNTSKTNDRTGSNERTCCTKERRLWGDTYTFTNGGLHLHGELLCYSGGPKGKPGKHSFHLFVVKQLQCWVGCVHQHSSIHQQSGSPRPMYPTNFPQFAEQKADGSVCHIRLRH